jgi:uncharacterized membrane protein YdjX (TVP38/TMEM64 family)
MSLEVVPQKRRVPVFKLVVLGVVVVVIAALVLRGVDVRGVAQAFMDLIRQIGPWAFFLAMAVLPALGAPMTAFTIPAGEAFAPQLGLGVVIAVSLAAIAVNMALAYWLSRYALRPLLTRLITRYGYTVPRVTPGNALNILLVVRLTPGPPYALQCFVLGVAEAPFRLYMIVSWLAVLPWAIGAIVLGKGIFNGNVGVVLIGIGVLVVASIGFQWLRKKYFGREAEAGEK